jgi:hypothetical protein
MEAPPTDGEDDITLKLDAPVDAQAEVTARMSNLVKVVKDMAVMAEVVEVAVMEGLMTTHPLTYCPLNGMQ